MVSELNEQTDEQLMKLYQGGSEAAFKVLYGRHSSKIYGYLKKRIRNKEKVAEVYQEVFIKIHKSKPLYNESLPVLPWIFTITKSVLMDEFRKESKVHTVDIDILENTPAQEAVVNSSVDVFEIVNQLPDLQRRAMEMRYLNDKTFEQIAESLNIQPSNARQIISRGIKRLREIVSDGGDRE